MSLRNAFAYLSALRIPPRARTPLNRSLHYFPWFGAAFGSLNVICFLLASRFFPAPVACLAAVLAPQAFAGFGPIRGAMEAAQGRRDFPGHGLAPGFRADARGLVVAALLLGAKYGALLLLAQDARVRAAFLFPILGMCARTFAFLVDARAHSAGGRAYAGRRVRAAFLSAALLFLAFLFPAPSAAALLAAGGAAMLLTLRLRRGNGGDHPGRLTLQTAALSSETAEAAALAAIVVMALIP